MPTAIELFRTSRTIQRDTEGNEVYTREYRVDTSDTTVALTAPEIPALLSPLPGGSPRLLARNYSVAADEGTVLVRVNYATPGIGTFTQPDREDPNYQRFLVSFKDVEQEIPSFVRLPVTKQTPGGASVELAWTGVRTITPETRVIYYVRLLLPNLTAQNIKAIADEINLLHKIQNVYYRFSCGDLQPYDADNIEIEYRWELDVGTPFVGNIDTRIITPPTIGTTQLMRSPFTRVVGFPPSDAVTGTPTFALQEVYRKNDDGWQNLPGDLDL